MSSTFHALSGLDVSICNFAVLIMACLLQALLVKCVRFLNCNGITSSFLFKTEIRFLD